MPPVPPVYWRRKEPIGAIVLIALGLLFLLGQLDVFSGRVLEFAWPIMLIGLGIWLIVRRLGQSQGGSK
jgi:ABC-type nickel/cobalt efflux system permease component RcnA